MDQPTVLTKFAKYYDTSFLLDEGKAIKMSLSSEFNDSFDTHISLSAEKIQYLSVKHNMPVELIKFYADKLSNLIHIVSLVGKSALDRDTAHMWGIYADNASGIALEFDYVELDSRANNTRAKQLAKKFYDFDHEKYEYLNLTQDQIYQNIKNNKRLACLEPDGIKALIHTFSGYNSTLLGRVSPYIQRLYVNLKNGIVDDDIIEVFNKCYKDIYADNKKFLYKISYTIDYTYLLQAFEAYLQYEVIKSITPNTSVLQVLESLNMKFYKTKSIVWQHENEYRLITPYYTHKDFIAKSANQLLEMQQQYLDEFKLNVLPPKYFYKYSNEVFSVSEDNISGHGGVTLINLPFPRNIYLGWKFDSHKDAGKRKNLIKKFCEEHNIGLFQLEPNFNYETNSFISHQIN